MKIYSRFLTILLIILVSVLLGVLGYYFYLLYDNYHSNKLAEELIVQFSDDSTEIVEISENIPDEEQTETYVENENQGTTKPQNNNTGNSNKKTGTYYSDYKVIGVIEIPSLNVKYPIFNIDNTTTLNLGTAAIYPINVEQALNKPGNVVIAGHNYRNNKMFSKLHTLKNDDSIYITDNSGKKLEYKVYNNYTANASDFTYATRKIDEDVAEISLSTCTNDVNTRTIIWAKAE